MIKILFNITALTFLFIWCSTGCSSNGRSGSKHSFDDDSTSHSTEPSVCVAHRTGDTFDDDSTSHSSQRSFCVAYRRGDTFLISSVSITIVDNKVMWYEATMESRAYAMADYTADSLSINFNFTKINFCHDLQMATLWTKGKMEHESTIFDITPIERHTISRYNQYIWYWQTAPGALYSDGYFLIDSVDVVGSGYTTYKDFFDITKDYRQVDDMNRTFYRMYNDQMVDTTERVRIDGKKVVWKSYWWKTKPDSTLICDLKDVFVRSNDEVVRLFVADTKDDLFFVYRSNENHLLWEDCCNLEVYYIDSVDVAKSGFKIK